MERVGQFERTTEAMIWLSKINPVHKKVVGLKAAHLAVLMMNGFNVPPGFCITTSAYEQHFKPSSHPYLQELKAEQRWEELREHILHLDLERAFVADLLANYRRLLATCPGPVAVRSSSTAEDLPKNSFAGVYESILNIESEPALLDAVRRCWASYWNPEAVYYRTRLGLNHFRHGMAVLIQSMIEPKYAGVLFTQAPSQNRPDVMIAELVQGNAAALLDGTAFGKSFVIDRTTKQVRPLTNNKLDAAPHFLIDLASLGLAIEGNQGAPQDVEWCLDDEGQLWIIQARPVTGTITSQDFSMLDQEEGWERVEYEPFSPLGCDLAVRRYHCWVKALSDYYRLPFTAEILTMRGFLYIKPSWRTPGFLHRIWIMVWKLLRWLQTNQIYKRYTDEILPAHVQHLSELDQNELPKLDDYQLMAGFNESIERYLQLQYTSLAVIETIKTSTKVFDLACRLMFKGEDLSTVDFLNGLDNHTVLRDLALHRLGHSLREIVSPEECTELDYFALMRLKDKSAKGRQFVEKLTEFLEKYGYIWADRYPRDPAWKINRELFVGALLQAAKTLSDDNLVQQHASHKEIRRQSIQRVTVQLSASTRISFRWLLFQRLLNQVSQLYPHKENRNHDVYRNVMVIRKYAQEIGRRLAEQGILQTAADVFFLNWDEIQEIARDKTVDVKWLRLVKQRKNDYRRSNQRIQRNTAETRHYGASQNGSGRAAEIELTGVACSPGVTIGPSILVDRFSELHRIKAGDVLVCRELRPAWSPVFSIAAAVVVEKGSLLSHGATLAREYGIPAVMNVSHLFETIRDGDTVTVDGNLGRVTVERNLAAGRN